MSVLRTMTWSAMDDEARRALCTRGLEAIFDADLKAAIGRIIDDVRANGDEAVCRALREFDHVSLEPHQLRATADEIADAAVRRRRRPRHRRRHRPPACVQRAADDARRGLELRERARPVGRREDHADQLRRPVRAERQGQLPQRRLPARSAGDGRRRAGARTGRAADARRQRAASIRPCWSCAASSGIDNVFRVNGPAGIAALGFGTESIPQVRKIVGPGSPPVACAQVEMQRYGVATMMILGPTESLVIADDSADPRYLAADLLNEAEHGTDSAVLLVTTSAEVARRGRARVGAADRRPPGRTSRRPPAPRSASTADA